MVRKIVSSGKRGRPRGVPNVKRAGDEACVRLVAEVPAELHAAFAAACYADGVRITMTDAIIEAMRRFIEERG